jgi:hypothetical protein
MERELPTVRSELTLGQELSINERERERRERERERAYKGPKSDLMMARRELTITRTDRPR